MRGDSILYIVGVWHLLGYIDGIDGYKNDIAYRLTIVVLGLFTLISGVLAGRMPLQWGRADLAVLQEPGDPDRSPCVVALSGLLTWSDGSGERAPAPTGLRQLPAANPLVREHVGAVLCRSAPAQEPGALIR
jgi:hypothetical protein